jgi:cytochrome c biogenesis protein CcmG/thiol:disulfide interchange protein DsbE
MKGDRILHASLVAMVCLFVAALYGTLRDTTVKAGDTAPNFSIRADNGKVITARDFGGKLLILNFWASWCAPCVYEAPSLNQLQRELGPEGLVVLGVSEDRSEKNYRDFLDRFDISFPTVRQPEETIKNRYGTIQLPETYIIDRNGKVVEKVVSEVDWTSAPMVQYFRSLL